MEWLNGERGERVTMKCNNLFNISLCLWFASYNRKFNCIARFWAANFNTLSMRTKFNYIECQSMNPYANIHDQMFDRASAHTNTHKYTHSQTYYRSFISVHAMFYVCQRFQRNLEFYSQHFMVSIHKICV